MTNIIEPKFEECRECFFFNRRSNACRSCDCGENFEPHAEELDPNGLDLNPGARNDDE